MKQNGIGMAGCFFLLALHVHGQSAIDQLDQDLQQIKAEHEAVASQTVASVLNQLTTAANSPQDALDLYQKAGGKMPTAAPVQTHYDHETPDEKDARDAIDLARVNNLAGVVQMHCGLMRYAILFITKTDPKDQKAAHDSFNAWFKIAAQQYPQLKDAIPDTRGADDQSGSAQPANQRRNRGGGGGGGQNNGGAPDGVAGEFKKTSLQDSVISKYLGYHGWNNNAEGQWSVSGLTQLYRTQVLEPLRVTPTADTLAAWDIFISMSRADERDADKWAQFDAPSLAFDRTCDDYAISPDSGKLQTLVEIIKANPNHPKADEMIGRAHQLMDAYRATHVGGKVVAAPTPLPGGDSTPTQTSAPAPPVSVTTSTQGDMTIITTHTNAPPVTPPQ